MYTLQTNCRACGYGPAIVPSGIKAAASSERLPVVFSLGVQPLANDFCTQDQERAGHAPLQVLLCPRCGLAQLSVNVKPEVLYSHYLYVTSKSQMMIEHFKNLWAECSSMAPRKTVMEIGSNDGHFLEFCRGNGAEAVVGIDPAENLAAAARQKNIPTVCGFWGPETARLAGQEMPKPGIIFARHVFCHVPNWVQFMESLAYVAEPDTIICIEVPYVMNQLQTYSFDQIYHEHLSYLSIRAMKALLNGGPFDLKKVLTYPIHGGAIVLVIQRRSADMVIDESVDSYLQTEENTPETWRRFGEQSEELINGLKLQVRELVNQGKRVVGYGASAKSTVWINACGFTRKEIGCVYDCTPEKWYRYIPGTDIPIVHEGGFYVDNPDYAVLFAWNFAKECVEKQKPWLRGGGQFILPVPSLNFIRLDESNPT